MRLAGLIGLVGVLGCSDVTAPRGAEPFTPPSSYAQLWAANLDCVGLGGSPDAWKAIRWYLVPNIEGTLDCGGVSAVGCWIPKDQVYLVAGHETNGRTVRHEMLHYLLRDPSHDNAAWKGCGL